MESILLAVAAFVIVFNLAFIAGALWANRARKVRGDDQNRSGLSHLEPTALSPVTGGQAPEGLGEP